MLNHLERVLRPPTHVEPKSQHTVKHTSALAWILIDKPVDLGKFDPILYRLECGLDSNYIHTGGGG